MVDPLFILIDRKDFYENGFKTSLAYHPPKPMVKENDQSLFFLSDEEEVEFKRTEPVIVFKLKDQKYALSIEEVKEVLKCPSITPIPQVPDHLVGVVNVRGNVYVVADLAHKFHLTEEATSSFKFLIILEIEDHAVAIGVSELPGSIQVDMDQLQPVHSVLSNTGEEHQYIKGFMKHEGELLTFLNLIRLIQLPDFSRSPNT
jgi:purine-binding chemotaxis protein CheW